MSARYAIAAYFSETARRAAARDAYAPQWFGFGDPAQPAPRNWDGCCPVGVMLRIDGPLNLVRVPAPEEVEEYLGKAIPLEAAERFIRDWDAGKIDDIYEALGVS